MRSGNLSVRRDDKIDWLVVTVSGNIVYHLLPKGQGYGLKAIIGLPGPPEICVIIAFAPAEAVALGGEGHPWHEDEVEAAIFHGLGAAVVVVRRLLDLPGGLGERQEVLVVGQPQHVHPGGRGAANKVPATNTNPSDCRYFFTKKV